MREPYKKGVAHHLGSESCASDRKDAGEALTGGSGAGKRGQACFIAIQFEREEKGDILNFFLSAH